MSTKSQARYHHGDLRPTLLREAVTMLRAEGLEGLSLRRLAVRAGVTAPALYHHFRDKNDLLCALAERGFEELSAITEHAIHDDAGSEQQRVHRFVRVYLGFASEHPEIYDLMFGRAIWKAGVPTESLKTLAHATFRRYVDWSKSITAPGAARRSKRSLRRAQAGWATLHGLCRFLIDGIYTEGADLDGMSEAATEQLLAARAGS